jgi:hypothetical protein
MSNPFARLVKLRNPEKEYPSSMGKRWSKIEDNNLLQELNNDLSIQDIANIHNRTIGGIQARQKLIALRMFNKQTPIDTITRIMRITEKQIYEQVEKQNSKKIKNNIEKELSHVNAELVVVKEPISTLRKIMIHV